MKNSTHLGSRIKLDVCVVDCNLVNFNVGYFAIETPQIKCLE
jgi:hypothetical protein